MLKQKIYIFSLVSVIFALMLAWSLSPLVPIEFWKIFIDGIVSSTLFLGISYLIWQIVKFGNYSALTFFQRIINYSAIGVLSISLWLGIGYGLFLLFFGETDSLLISNILWIKGFIGILVFSLLIQYFHYQNVKNEINVNEQNLIENKIIKTQEHTDKKTLARISVKNGTKINVITTSEIIYIEADGDYVKIHTEKGKFMKEETMKYFEEHLPENQFVRVHRSYIVNVEMVQRVEVYEK